MKKLLYTLALAGMMVPAMQARTISADKAMSNVAAFTSSAMQKAPALRGAPLKLAGTIDYQGMPALYLFTTATDNGVVVASASDLTPAVLGYADAGAFNMQSMPDGMKYMLDMYAEEIAMAENGQTMKVAYDAPAERAAIDPLCKTTWNQNAPYNDLTPMLSGQHCMTGCVATAMAQVMKVHEWPADHGTGFVSYTWTYGAETLSYNLANSTMDWANMLNSYDSKATAEQNNAVASLMRDCGYATNMQYSLNASGTSAVQIPRALYYNFGYDAAVRTLQRLYYSQSQWENIVYSELENGCPVMFTGVSDSQGGHCFVCDGYSSDRYFHINWGWGGMSDGYFLLSALNPETQGIGGSTGGFNNGVNICVGIKKPVEGSKMFTEIIGEGAYNTQASTYTSGQNVMFTANGFTNTSMETVYAYLGVKLTDAAGNVTYIQCPEEAELESYYYTNGYYIPVAEFPSSGTYTVTPAWLNGDTNKWLDIPFPINEVSSLTLTIDNGTLTFAQVPLNANLEVTDIKLLTDMYTNTNFEVSANLVNNGTSEYLGTITVALVNADNQIKAQSSPINVDVEGGDTEEIDVVTKFTRAPSAGTYYLCFTSSDNKIISDKIEVELTALSGRTSITLDNLHMASGNGGDPATVPSNDVRVAGTVKCTSGYFNNAITCYIFPQNGGSSLGTLGTENFFVKADNSKDFEFKGSFGNGVEGTTYMIGFFFNNTQINNAYVYFVLGEPTSVKVVEGAKGVTLKVEGNSLLLDGADTADIDIYSTDGSHVMALRGTEANFSSLAPGTYIAVARTAEGPVMLKFIR
ncbi:MAG: C10 family peptidase [Muribaculaceae bacterium]|nr:C10 family peptidase [Muribaculaceae bacterium]